MRKTRGVRLAALALLLPFRVFAHDAPNDVTVRAFLKPQGNQLNLLVRAPMAALQDLVLPERGRGYLDFERAAPLLPAEVKVWLSDAIDIYEGNALLPKPRVEKIRIALESDKSFLSYDQALAHFGAPELTNDTDVVWSQTFVDVWFVYPIQSEKAAFAINPALAKLGVRVLTVLRVLLPGGIERAFEFSEEPGVVRIDPSWTQAAGRFVVEGFRHILDGTDHLLFLFCLVIPFRRFRVLVPVVTGFTVAHSITLIGSAYGLAPDALWFPPLIETLIAASIVYMAVENCVGAGTVHRRWMVAFGFGLVHGFGFSFALRQTLQFAGTHLITSLLSFNVGIEIGQLLVLAVLIPVLQIFFRHLVTERAGTMILSVFIAHTAWHWMLDRGEVLRKFQYTWPTFDAIWLASVLRGLIAVTLVAGLVWLTNVFLRRKNDFTPPQDSTELQ